MWTQTWTTTVRDCTLLYIVNLSNYMIMVNQIINRILVQFCFLIGLVNCATVKTFLQQANLIKVSIISVNCYQSKVTIGMSLY